METREADKISIILPTFNEEKNVVMLYEKLTDVIKHLSIPNKEIIFVDDGSTDNTIENIKELAASDPDVKFLRLSTRVGHQISCFAGIKAATGDIVVSMDSDLQHPPEVISELYRKWQEGYDIVNTVRKDTLKRSFLKKMFSRFFYSLINRISSLDITPNTADFRLLARNAVTDLLTYEDRDLFLRGIISNLSYKKAYVEYVALARRHGESKYDFRQSLRFGFMGIFYFSELPLKLSGYASIVCILFTIGFVIYEIVQYATGHTSAPGYITIVLLINIYFFFILFILGIIGIYINKIYHQTKHKPVFYIAEKINLE
ncbi:MAG: glycosyltransferase family 2 protein [Spirochaetales bacterium]|nr:glycosyltransferase family 2 protein [Spirochaetales bacterium]